MLMNVLGSELRFALPVEIGSLLLLDSRVTFSPIQGEHRSFHVSVEAGTVDLYTGEKVRVVDFSSNARADLLFSNARESPTPSFTRLAPRFLSTATSFPARVSSRHPLLVVRVELIPSLVADKQAMQWLDGQRRRELGISIRAAYYSLSA